MKVKYANYVILTDDIGDNAQVYALDHIYERMGIPKDDIIYFNRENIEETIEKDCRYVLPLVIADIAYYDLIEYLIERRHEDQFIFLPLSLGQTRYTFGNTDRLAKFRNVINLFQMPIGCRDYDSASMYKDLGYCAYVNGCITNTLPKRKDGHYDTVYLIDIPPSFLEYLPQDLKDNAVCLTQSVNSSLSGPEQQRVCAERYDLLRDTASLVITCRYHIATPCCAMGIPVIMVENCDEKHHWTTDVRFHAMNPGISFYTKEQWVEIDFSPDANRPTDYEDVKSEMIELAISRIRNAACVAEVSDHVDRFLKPSKDRFWGVFLENRNKIDCFGFSCYLDSRFLSKIQGNFRYYLYGLSDRYIQQNECLILDYILRHYPEAEFLGFVDSKKTGTYFGKPVLDPNEMLVDEDTYCVVSALTANEYVEGLFEERGFNKAHLWKMPRETLFYIYHL